MQPTSGRDPHNCSLSSKPHLCGGTTVIGEQMRSGEGGPDSGTSNFTRSKEAHRIRRPAPLKRKCTTDNIMSTAESIKVGRSLQSLFPSSPHHPHCDQLFHSACNPARPRHSVLLLKIMFRPVRERLLALYGPQNNRRPSPRGHPFSTVMRTKMKNPPLPLIHNKIGSLP